jgi:hypothetical protein
MGAGIDTACFDGDGEAGDGGTALLTTSWLFLEVLLTLLCGVKPKPPSEVLDAGFALAGSLVAIDEDLPISLPKLPSLVPGLLDPFVPLRLRLEAGRGGGPMGLSTGEKKLDRLRSLGVEGKFWILSIVLSLNDGREDLAFWDTVEKPSISVFSGCSGGDSSREPGRDDDR